jgi:hypothetical protein
MWMCGVRSDPKQDGMEMDAFSSSAAKKAGPSAQASATRPLVSQRAPLYCFCVSLHGSRCVQRAGRGRAKAFGTFSPHVPHTHLACTCICMHVRLLPLPCVFFICHPHLYIHLLTATATALRGIMRRGLSMTNPTSKCWGGTECPSCRVNK